MPKSVLACTFGGKSVVLTFAYALFSVLWPGTQASAADDVDAILQQIKSESTRGSAPQPAPPAATAKKTARLQSSKSKSRQPQAPQTKRETFSGPIWGPKDKFPKQIRGHGLAGTFVIAGQFQGCMQLEALEDHMNPFCRTFIVANKRLDLPNDYFIPLHRRETVTIPRSRPLVFLEKGPLAFYYVHMH